MHLTAVGASIGGVEECALALFYKPCLLKGLVGFFSPFNGDLTI